MSVEFNRVKCFIQDIITKPQYFDVFISFNRKFSHEFLKENVIFAYIFEGRGYFGENEDSIKVPAQLIFNGDEEGRNIIAKVDLRFLLASKKLNREPIAWYNHIVMNMRE
ncbi:MAG: pirin-like C-terminal cupin domain-containing protein [Promethearchaeota archaeon]